MAYENFVSNERLSLANGIRCPKKGIVWGMAGGSLGVYVGDVYQTTSEKRATMPPQMAVESPIILISRRGRQ